jgi:hypothetical protein
MPLAVCLAGAALLALASCGDAPAPSAAKQKPETAIPAEFEVVARGVLGSEAEVVAHGDLAKTSEEQVLVVNRLGENSAGSGELRVTRAVIVAKHNGGWKEMFRCDEHLKNPQGFLAGTPTAAVSSWRLRWSQDAENGLTLYLTPALLGAAADGPKAKVRWNRAAKRYQTMGDKENFLGETPALEAPTVRLGR